MLLPYGLSSAHREFCTRGEHKVIPFGLQTKRHVLPLQELAGLSVAATTTNASRNAPHTYSPRLKKRRKDAQQAEMGLVRTPRKINTRSATSKKRRDNLPKTKPIPPMTAEDSLTLSSRPNEQRRKLRGRLRPKTHIGASRDIPIILDSDDEAPGSYKASDKTSVYSPGYFILVRF